MFNKFLVIIALKVLLLSTKCSADCKEGDEIECASIDDIKQGEEKSEWKNVNVKGKQQAVKEDSFFNIPNVEKLIFTNAVNKINRNSFKNLSKLKKLQFFNNDIPEIQSYAFDNSAVEELLIYTSNVKQMKNRCFDNLKNLKAIYVHKNSIAIIRAAVFSYSNIEYLYLNENGIRTIEEEAFYGMDKLKTIALERNFLVDFDSYALVGNTSPNLNLLWLARNNITKMDNNLLKPFPKLKVLLMHINIIDTIADGTFNSINDLRYIDLSNNKLTSLNHKVFPWEGLNRMDMLFLQNNRFIYLSTDVIAKLPRLAKIAIGGNPWLCPCYQELKNYIQSRRITLLCDDEYLDGKRPVCVSPNTKTNKCSTKDEEESALYDIYLTAQMDYVKLPPLCKIYCGDNKSCYSHDFDVLAY